MAAAQALRMRWSAIGFNPRASRHDGETAAAVDARDLHWEV